MEDTQLGETLLGDAEATGRAGAGRVVQTLGRGSTVGRYVVLDVLGSGAMGVVYAAFDPDLDRRLAVKLLRPSPGSDAASTSGRGRLIREAQALARLSHPNVVTVHDVGEHEDQVFVAMEFIDGISLRAWLDDGPRSQAQILDVLTRAGRGLAAAHEKDLVHRDFKPDNVMLELAEGTGLVERVVVLDFGLATPASGGVLVSGSSVSTSSLTSGELMTNLTRTGAVMGTPAYMSAEQHYGRATDARSDQFSFCVTLYEALYGARPFAGDTLGEIAANVVRNKIRPAPASSRVPGWLRRVVVRGLASKPDDRWPSMSQLLAALEADPTRMRRRLGLVGVGVVALGLTLGAVRWREHDRAQACERQAAAIDEVWNDGVRARVREGVLGTKLDYAAATWELLAPRFDERAEVWRDARRSTCLARDDLEARLRTVQTECLDASKDALADRLEILETADQTVLNAAPAWSLHGKLDECLDPVRLRRREPLPEDPDKRERVRTLQRRISRVSLLANAAKYDDALELADACLQEARELERPSLVAAAQLQRGFTLGQMERFEDAESALEDAFFTAREIDDDDTAASAARRLTEIVGANLSRQAQGRRWARHARLLAEDAGLTELDEAELDLSLASLEFRAGNYAKALELGESVRARFERLLGPTSPRVVATLLFTVGAYDRLAKSEEAVATARRALDLGLQTYGEDHPVVADLHQNLAVSLMDPKGYEEAERHLRRALEISVAAKQDPTTGTILDNLVLALRAMGRLDEALETSERSLALQRRIRPKNHPSVGVSLVNHGQTLEELGKLEEALAEYREALAIFEDSLGPDHATTGDTAYVIATGSFRHREFQDAVDFGRRSLETYRRAFGDDHPKIFRSYNVILGAAMYAPDYDTILELAPALMKRLDDAKLEPATSSAMITAYGVALRERGRYDEAVRWLQRGVDECTKPGVPPGNLETTQFDLARALWETGEHERARQLAVDALADLRKIEGRNPQQFKDIEAWLRAHR